jgi:CysZ protein
MRFIREFKLGIASYWKALLFMREHKLYWYILIPAVLMLGIYQLGYWISEHQFTTETKTMNGIVWYLIQLMIEISIALLLMKFSKYLVVALLSPLLAYLSQKTERLVSGKTYPFSFKQLWADIRRGLKIVVRNIMWEYFFFLIIFIISTLGWENAQKSPLFYLTFFIGFFYYGFSFMDYVNERKKRSVDDSILYIRKHRGIAIALGTVYSLLILVPVDLSALFDWSSFSTEPMGAISTFLVHLSLWICASAAPILTSIAATLAMHKLEDQELEEMKSIPKNQS